MGLAIEVGHLVSLLENDEDAAGSFCDELDEINALLQMQGLPEHVEPDDCPVYSESLIGFSGLQSVRRLAAHLDIKGKLPPPGDASAGNDPVLQSYYRALNGDSGSFLSRLLRRTPRISHTFDHLIDHSDAEGYYLPIDFHKVLVAPASSDIVGETIGSSHALLRELQQLARAIDLPLDLDPNCDEVCEAIGNPGNGDTQWKRYGLESSGILALHTAASHSVEHNSMIVFC